MKRREFIALVGGATAAWPFVARAQQPVLPVVALINGGAANASANRAAAFRKGLSESGYAEGQNVTVEYHWLDGHYERLPAVLDDLVRRRVAVIATPGSSNASLAAKAATATIPIVFGIGEDPVALGLVTSLSRPGGNTTGINFFAFEVDAKRLGLMHELLPKASRFAVLVNPANAAATEAASKALKEAARALGLEILFFNLPAVYGYRPYVDAGGLMSYGVDLVDLWRLSASYVDRILRGANPADLPVQAPTKYETVVNLKTAKAFGLDVPSSLLVRADAVIE